MRGIAVCLGILGAIAGGCGKVGPATVAEACERFASCSSMDWSNCVDALVAAEVGQDCLDALAYSSCLDLGDNHWFRLCLSACAEQGTSRCLTENHVYTCENYQDLDNPTLGLVWVWRSCEVYPCVVAGEYAPSVCRVVENTARCVCP